MLLPDHFVKNALEGGVSPEKLFFFCPSNRFAIVGMKRGKEYQGGQRDFAATEASSAGQHAPDYLPDRGGYSLVEVNNFSGTYGDF